MADKRLKVLELYSGIGGMHHSLNASGVLHEVIEAYDVSTVANAVYSHNFPHTPVNARGIESLTAAKLSRVSMVTMSPPCQPFTRVGKKRDELDPRSRSFLHFLDILAHGLLPAVPAVKGFEESKTHDRFLQVLQSRTYHYQEFLLTPLQFGIPNSRLRYYLMASLHPLPFNPSSQIMEELPSLAQEVTTFNVSSNQRPSCCHHGNSILDTHHSQVTVSGASKDGQIGGHDFLISSESLISRCHECDVSKKDNSREIVGYLEEKSGEYFVPYMLNDPTLLRLSVMDVVSPASQRCTCFTKGYGRYVKACGSMLQTNSDVKMNTEEMKEVMKRLDASQTPSGEDMDVLRGFKLRYFTPQEICNLHGLPSTFSFPQKTTDSQKYRLLGNSLSVYVVAGLIRVLLHSPAVVSPR